MGESSMSRVTGSLHKMSDQSQGGCTGQRRILELPGSQWERDMASVVSATGRAGRHQAP